MKDTPKRIVVNLENLQNLVWLIGPNKVEGCVQHTYTTKRLSKYHVLDRLRTMEGLHHVLQTDQVNFHNPHRLRFDMEFHRHIPVSYTHLTLPTKRIV